MNLLEQSRPTSRGSNDISIWYDVEDTCIELFLRHGRYKRMTRQDCIEAGYGDGIGFSLRTRDDS